jgi:hypothetical protein
MSTTGINDVIAGTTQAILLGQRTNDWYECKCCGRDLGLPRGSRGLCDGCDEDIPKFIPKEQYLTYMKELWRKR